MDDLHDDDTFWITDAGRDALADWRNETVPAVAMCTACHTPVQLVDADGPHADPTPAGATHWAKRPGGGCLEAKGPASHKCCGNCPDVCIRGVL